MSTVLLDMYGVILRETGDDFAPYVQSFFPQLSEPEISEIWYRADRGEISSLDVWRQLGFTGDIERREKEYLDTISLNPGFYEFAEKANRHGKLGLISNDSARWSRYFREKFGINSFFDAVSVSGELKMWKPNEDIFRYTLDKLGVSSGDCVYVDDRRRNLQTAKNLGMRIVLFNSRNTEFPCETVSSFEELAQLLW